MNISATRCRLPPGTAGGREVENNFIKPMENEDFCNPLQAAARYGEWCLLGHIAHSMPSAILTRAVHWNLQETPKQRTKTG